MGHGHSHGEDVELTAAQKQHQSQAMRILVALLVPLAIATFASLALMWPKASDTHIRDDTGTDRVPGTTVQKGVITHVTRTSCENQAGTYPGDTSVCAKLTVKVLDGPDAGKTQKFDINSAVYQSGAEPGQKVRMYRVPVEGMTIYSFIDFDRTTPLVFFVALFAVLVVLVARLRGFLSLIGLGFAFFILTQFMMPNLLQGKDPLIVGVVASAAIMFVVLYTSHGFTVRTTTALVGTLFGLLVSAVLGVFATRWSHLTGVVHEDDFMLAASAPDLKLTSVVVCSMIVGALGALNDVTITQASAVWELGRQPNVKPMELYRSAMRIGRDHIASTVYTIAFASAGAALAVLLLINVYHQPLAEMLVQEMFAGEILRTVIGSIGLMLAVPLTTAVGVIAVTTSRRAAADSTPDPELPEVRADQDDRGRREHPHAKDEEPVREPAHDPTLGLAPAGSRMSASPAPADDEPADAPVRPRRGAPQDDSIFKRPE